jgi:hypothetical protein
MKRLALLAISLLVWAAPVHAGWYLIQPPNISETSCSGWTNFYRNWHNPETHQKFCKDFSDHPDFEAPLSRWRVIGEFEHLAECREKYTEFASHSAHYFWDRCVDGGDARLAR